MDKTFVGLILIAVGLIVFPVVLTGAATILADANIADYTGLETLVEIAPLLIFIGFLGSGGVLTFQGIQAKRSSRRR